MCSSKNFPSMEISRRRDPVEPLGEPSRESADEFFLAIFLADARIRECEGLGLLGVLRLLISLKLLSAEAAGLVFVIVELVAVVKRLRTGK